ncbi:ATPase family AAA domain-containing protein 2 [Orchesella cincta]|uniref:ATPase family AAA domain-containing protein 2 n=1 Tax=Orchesella cincta TaxID=48709 RepID=A0A1D2NH40_ORCCI|nr:ATPase family AAA domain-containing protein 2 [Orchesella cincta]
MSDKTEENGEPMNTSNEQDNMSLDQVEDMVLDEEAGVQVNESESNATTTGSGLRLEKTASFSVAREDFPPVQATFFKASWNGNTCNLTDILCNNFAQLQNSPLEAASQGDSDENNGNRNPKGNWKAGPKKPTPISSKDFKSFFGLGGSGSGGGGGGDAGPNDSSIYFKDCGGLEEQVKFVQTALLGPLTGKSNNQFKRFGLEPPKGILFFGPPGTGKTRLAHAISNEVKLLLGHNVHFIYRKGNDIASKYFGESSANLRRVFEEAKQMKPTVLFFDELDGLCPSRDKPFISEANVSIVTTMLGLMDELPKGEIFVIGATNRLESIDPALRRPGRFDKHLEFLPPTQKGRFDILRIHTKGWKTVPEANLLNSVSEKTVGFSGADLSKLCSDTFDSALAKFMDANKHHNLTTMPFHLLKVKDEDWNAALLKMKPSASAVFGSVLYTPSKGLGKHVHQLVQSNILNLMTAIRPVLPTLSAVGGIKSLYIMSGPAILQADMDDMIMSSLFRSAEIAPFPIYNLSCEVLSSVRWTEWPSQINSAFSQAVNSHQPSILYMPMVDELWKSIVGMNMTTSVNLPQLIESLRGRKVLLIGTGSANPSDFKWDSPFKQAFRSTAVQSLNFPTNKERTTLFQDVLATTQVHSWSEKDVEVLETIQDAAVEATNNRGIGSVVCLHDGMAMLLNIHGSSDPIVVTRMLMDLVGEYKRNELRF